MANLIPPKARATVIREYWARAVTVWLALLALAGIVIVVLMIPTYVLVTMQHTALANRADEARSQQEAFTEANEQIEAANELLTYIDRNKPAASFVSLIDTLDELTGTEVQMTRISFAQDRDEVAPIDIQGEAAHRTALADFRDALEASEIIATVDLPISNLAGDSNIPFAMEITLENE